MMCEHCGRVNGYETDGWRRVNAGSSATHRLLRCGGCGHEQWMR